jgi:hypothetical protein
MAAPFYSPSRSRTATASTSLGISDFVLFCRAPSAGSVLTVTLPNPATNQGRSFWIVARRGTVAFAVTGATSIYEGESVLTGLGRGGRCLLQSDGTQWGTVIVHSPALQGVVSTVLAPTISGGSVTGQSNNLVSMEWLITVATGGTAAASLTVDLFDATDTAFATALATQQVITTGIGLGAVVTVNFNSINGFNGAAPRSFVIRAEAV